MQALFKDTKALQKVLRVLANTNKLTNLVTTPTGMSVQALTATKTTMLSMTLTPDFFSHYESESHVLGLPVAILETLVKTARGEDIVGFMYKAGADVLVVRIGAPSGEGTTEYQVKLINIEEETLAVPDFEVDAQVTIPAGVFHGWRTKTALANGPVRFVFEQQQARVEATSDEWGTVQVAHKVVPDTFRARQTCTVSNASMVALNTLATCGAEITFGAKPDIPLVATVRGPGSLLTLYVAPMMEDD